MTEFTVDLMDLRRALLSVVPHASKDKDLPLLRRVRLTPFGVNVEVTATDRYTAALAVVSLWDSDGEADVIDLELREVHQLLTVFPPPAKGEEAELTISTTSGEVTFRDTAGLVDGKALVLPRATVDEKFPDLRTLFVQRLGGAPGVEGEAWFHADHLARFKAAENAYGYPLILDRVPLPARVWVVRCGESFLGLITPVPADEGARSQAASWVAAWRDRLAGYQPRAGYEDAVSDLLKYGTGVFTIGEDGIVQVDLDSMRAERVDDEDEEPVS